MPQLNQKVRIIKAVVQYMIMTVLTFLVKQMAEAAPKVMVRWDTPESDLWTKNWEKVLPKIQEYLGTGTYTWQQTAGYCFGYFVPCREIPSGQRFTSESYRELHHLLTTYGFGKVSVTHRMICFDAGVPLC
jgi:hypothetical protein